jgi:hypothetical protein
MVLKTAVELSPHRDEIDKKLEEGETPRAISEWLKTLKENPEKISHTAINNYRKNKFNVYKEAAKKYKENENKSKKRLDKASNKVVNDLSALDELIDEGRKLKLNIDTIKPDPKNGVSYIEIEKLKIQVKNLLIRAAKTKHDILKDEPTPLLVVPVEDADDIEQRLIKQLADDIARQRKDKESNSGK